MANVQQIVPVTLTRKLIFVCPATQSARPVPRTVAVLVRLAKAASHPSILSSMVTHVLTNASTASMVTEQTRAARRAWIRARPALMGLTNASAASSQLLAMQSTNSTSSTSASWSVLLVMWPMRQTDRTYARNAPTTVLHVSATKISVRHAYRV